MLNEVIAQHPLGKHLKVSQRSFAFAQDDFFYYGN